MAPTSSTEYTPEERRLMREVAHKAIDHGLAHGHALQVDPARYPPALREMRATFVTIHLGDMLRGCIGVLEACAPLIADVARNAHAAAFSDPRFPPLTNSERPGIALKISILTPPEPIAFRSEQDLVQQLRPGQDGLVLEAGYHRGTFLPAVWDSLPNRREFLQQLKKKAGLNPAFWSDEIRVQRYRAIEIS